MRQSQTLVVERNVKWEDEFQTEPVEVSWASEAIYFIRALETEGPITGVTGRVQISPDGMHWCDEGTVVPLPSSPGVTFERIRQFGGWLRIVGRLPARARAVVIVYLALKE